MLITINRVIMHFIASLTDLLLLTFLVCLFCKVTYHFLFICFSIIFSCSQIYQYLHETIIRTGITCKKIPCYMRDSACKWLKKLKYFKVMLNIFEFLLVWENVESWLVYANKLFWIAQPYFSTNTIKQS